MSEIFEDIKSVEVIVDDLLIWGESDQQHDDRLMQVLDRARERNLKLNIQKCQIKRNKISYVGHILTKEGLRPDTKKTEAILNMPSPKNKEELQRFLGMLTYLASSFRISPTYQHHYEPCWKKMLNGTDRMIR